MGLRHGCVVVLVTWFAACGSALPALPSKGGPAWTEFKSEHFTVWTDASAKRGAALVRKLEHHRQVIMRGMNRAQQNSRIFVIALRDEREVAEFLPDEFAARAWTEGSPSRQIGILMPADNPNDDNSVTVSHELAHAVSFAVFRHQPSWLAEGIAGYFEMVELDPNVRSVEIGKPHKNHIQWIRQAGLLPAAQLFACEEAKCKDGKFYATSWAMISYLINEQFDKFALYLQRLNLPGGSHDQAWSEAFPDMSLAQLDRNLLRGLMSSRKWVLPRIAIDVQPYRAVERALGDADALAARSLLHWIDDKPALSIELALSALAIDRRNVLAWMLAHYQDHPIPLADARSLTEAHPTDWRAWMLLYTAAEGEEEEQAKVRACTLAAADGKPCAVD
jgi:Protein of unknown function (DUF1570)